MLLQARIAHSISEIDAGAWNALLNCNYPFLQHDFLLALEKHNCLEPWGWQPVIFQLYDNEALLAACSSYIKTNSYGEFVFDSAWADAYQRNGMAYYPKLVTSIPYTPVQGARLLAKNDDENLKQQLLQLIITFCNEQSLSSSHFLFCQNSDMQLLKQFPLLTRFDFQYHWHNKEYQCFDDFLGALNSKRRKNIKRERRLVSDENITIKIIHGSELSEAEWHQLYGFYQITFMRKSGVATFTLEFFQAIAQHLRAIFAYHDNKAVAGAICYEGDQVFYGRHWGCYDHFDNLHFEVCYYTGIEYCIENQLHTFEPGAQGEHKIWRGFLPVKTESAHWIAHDQFRTAIADHLKHEARAMENFGKQLLEASPYKSPHKQ